MRIKQIITERYINLIGTGDKDKKQKYKDEVFAILQRSYKDIGGIKGAGFESADSMVENIPFWKLVKKDGNLVAVVLYKDKQGRKAVASGTDGSLAGKRAMMDVVKSEPSRSYAEKSKASLNFFLKSMRNKDPEEFLISVEDAVKISPDNLVPISSIPQDKWPIEGDELDSALITLEKYPYLRDYAYFREMGGKHYFKVMVGTPFQPIKRQ